VTGVDWQTKHVTNMTSSNKHVPDSSVKTLEIAIDLFNNVHIESESIDFDFEGQAKGETGAVGM
jgi:hypothetical protein